MADQRECLRRFLSLFARNYDLTLICEEKEVRASKSVLFNSCPYFEGLLSGSFPDGKGDVIKIDNTSYDVLTVVVNYATFKQLYVEDWDIEKWIKLLITAHEYNFQDLLQQASEVFDVNEFDLLTVLEAFPLLVKLDLTQVINKVWSHVETFAHIFTDSKNRHRFLAWPQLFVEAFVQRDTLNVLEVDLLDAITEWLEQHADVDLDSILNHIHWNEISDSDPRKKLWLGWSKDTSYKVKKPRCLSVPQTFQQRYIIPDYNIAQFGASQGLLLKSDTQFASPAYLALAPHYQHNIYLSRSFAINAIKFRLNTAQHSAYRVAVSTTDGKRLTVTPESMTGCSYQEHYFEPKIVNRIDIMSGFSVNSLECMYSTDIPAFRNSCLVAEKNMIVATTAASIFTSQNIEYILGQKCYVSTLALYLGCDDDHQFELFDSHSKQISPTKLSVVKDRFLRVQVLQFEEVLLHKVTVKSKDGLTYIVKAECPASKSVISKVAAIKCE